MGIATKPHGRKTAVAELVDHSEALFAADVVAQNNGVETTLSIFARALSWERSELFVVGHVLFVVEYLVVVAVVFSR